MRQIFRRDQNSVEILEDRTLLAADFGDAPDTAAGTATGNYETISDNGGPSHTIDATQTTLFLGNSVDGDDGTLQNARANADDQFAAGASDDEDGVLNPLELRGTIGAQPTITLLVTNTTGSAAMLAGWIDYNGDGVFENATERAQIAIPDGTTAERVTLTFPSIPVGSTGTTYARFRLSTDGAAASSTGPADDGEVEDYVFEITAPSSGTVDHFLKIAHETNGGPTFANSDLFGQSVASVGDLDGDGIADLAVGAYGDDTGGFSRGAVHVLLLNSDGTVKSSTKIASDTNGGPTLANSDFFGISVAGVGDLDGDGVSDLVVGANRDDTGGSYRGAVHVLLLNSDGTVKSSTKIAHETSGGPTLANDDQFGRSVAAVGDLDGDGVADLVVGANRDDTGGSDRGAVHVLLLNSDGTVKSSTKIAHETSGGPTLANYDQFGRSVAAMGDLDGDGVADLAVGAIGDSTGGFFRGAVHVLLLNSDGTVKSSTKIASDTNGGPTLANSDLFGSSVAAVGDLDGDGVADLAVGATGDDTDGNRRGAVHVLLLNSDGTVKSSTKIASGTSGGPTLADFDLFGSSVASVGDLDGDGIADLAVGASSDGTGGSSRGAVHILSLSPALDYGDAPDTTAGTFTGDYRTTQADNGPSHVIVPGLHLGNSVIGDSGTAQNAAATADDAHGGSPTLHGGDNDEDGVLNPLDLRGTIGAQPTITLLVTNTTGSAAMLAGWIDYNGDGVFENATERAQIAIPDGTTAERVTLTFPSIPVGATGTTYARFRLSTDGAAASSTGPADDGEVEDYVFEITAPSSGTVDHFLKIAHETNGGPTLANFDLFGGAVASVGDLDGDGVTDLAVGAIGDDTGGSLRGAVHVLLLNSDGTVKSSTKIASDTNGGPTLANDDQFGRSVAAVGDLDGDGVADLVVGANRDDTGGSLRGAVHVLLLNSDGTVKSSTKIAHETSGGPTLANYDQFGRSVAAVGDLDGDGVADLAVGAIGDSTGGFSRGAVHVLLLNSDGTVKSSTMIAHETSGGPTLADRDFFGSSVAAMGDLDGDGVADLAVGAIGDDTGGYSRGAVHVLLLNSDGTVKSSTKIASGTSGGPTLANDDQFGRSVAAVGDLDGDGVADLVVGANRDDTGGSLRGAVHVLLLNSDGTVKSATKIAHETSGGPTLADFDFFGGSVAGVGDLDGDGVSDLAVGADGDDTGGYSRGAVYILSLSPALDYGDAPDTTAGTSTDDYRTTQADNGPSHVVVSGLHLGSSVDGFGEGAFQNDRANADDRFAAGGNDDEDGVLDPLDLRGTEGSAPTITLLATNTTGSAATLYGWVDLNKDGAFDNSTERVSVSVPNGTTAERVTLTFPSIPVGAAGTTYARFRLSTDGAAASSTGPADDGEVEDYVFEITAPSSGTVDHFLKIAHETNGGPTLANSDLFGGAVASVGDLDGDGVADLAVGAEFDDTGGSLRGAVHVLLLNSDGTVKSSTKIASDTNGGPTLANYDRFGSSVAGVGDLDGDGVADLAVGAIDDSTGGFSHGAVHVLLLNSDGTVKSSTKIAHETSGGPTLANYDRFGSSVAALGDLDGDGVADLAVGAIDDSTGGFSHGAVHVLLLNSDGTVKSSTKIAHETNGGPTLVNSDRFGRSVASVGDLNGDGVADLAVGASGDSTGGFFRGAVHVLLLNSDGTVKSSTKIASGTSGGPTLANVDYFGSSVAAVGDLDGDGVADLAVGAYGDDTGGSYRGAVHVLLLNSDGTVKSATKIAHETSGGPTLADFDFFGGSVAGVGDLDGDGVSDLAVGADGDDTGGYSRGAVYILSLSPALDYGDAPDTTAGTSTDDYRTTQADNGPSHVVVSGLHLGSSVDGFGEGAFQNDRANADDRFAAGGNDDEDGVLDPLDLRGTEGAAPTITLLATNTTGSAATLSGWIDYNQDGVFDNVTERAQIAVPDGSTDGRFTLTFLPAIPSGSTGTTYARFRLSTDGAAASSTGPADDGEVEDYVFEITAPSSGTVDHFLKIAHETNGGPTLVNSDRFGRSVASVGDLDGDGVADLAVGAYGDDTGGPYRGAVHVLLLNSDGTVKSSTKIASDTNGGPTLANSDFFGISVASVGDLDGDGVADLAVGAYADDTGGSSRGAVHVLLLNSDGTVKSSTKIASDTNGGPTLANSDFFGSSVAGVGDLDGDGVSDLVVGANRDDTGGSYRGAVHVLLLNSDGTVKSSTKIAHATSGGPTLANFDLFGSSVAAVGDLDGDGVSDLAVGAYGDDTGGSYRGAVHVLLLNSDGTVKSSTKIASGTSGGPTLADTDYFGGSVASVGDLNGDGVADLAVGASGDDTGGSFRGAVHVLLLNSDGTVKSATKIASGTSGGPTLEDRDLFGGSVASVGDLNGDGVAELAVGARGDDTGGSDLGAVYVLSLSPALDYGDAPDTTAGTSTDDYRTTQADNGPSHVVVSGLHLGSSVDGFGEGAFQNDRANADDRFAAGGNDDEDGVLDPLDLRGTEGAAPTITLLATNTTGSAATLSGWIDYNQDGVFDNVTERAQIAVPDGSTDGRFTLTFLPAIPSGSTGTTYARFRLSTDGAAASSTGPADDGEVEDYVFEITAPSSGTVDHFLKIAHETNGGPTLVNSDRFGRSVASVGDLDGDGVADLAVGAYGDDTGGPYRGAVHVLLLNSDGTVKSSTKIASDTNGGPTLANSDFFGISVASVGDLDGDGVADLAVGAYADDTGGSSRGAVHVLLLNSDGTVKSSTKIASDTNGGPTLANSDFFGSSVAGVGDLDGDGVSDLVVGANRDDTGGSYRGAVHVLLLNSDGTVKSSTKIAHATSGGPTLANFDLFGSSVAAVGDLDGDGVSDLAVGAYGDDTGGSYRGAVHVLLLNSDGTVKSSTKIASGTSGGPTLADTDYFGGSVASVGDLNGDGVADLAVGASGDDTGGSFRGAVHVLLLNSDGTVKSATKIASGTSGGPTLEDRDLFGGSVASVGDLNGDGVAELAVGARGDDTGGSDLGAVHVLFLAPADRTAPTVNAALDDTSLKIGETATVTFTFDETPVGFAADDVAVQNGTLSAFTATGDPLIFTATFTPTAGIEDATNVISVGTGYTDAAGNAGTAGASANYAIDTQAPAVSIAPDGTVTSDSLIVFTFQFSEAVSGFLAEDISIANGSAETFIPVDVDTFTLEVTPASPGTVTVSVLSGAALDAAGNLSVSASASVTSSAPGIVVLPAAGTFEILLSGGDLVVRNNGGAEQFRRSAVTVSVLEITGSSGADIVTVLNTGGAVMTPIVFSGGQGADQFDASLATGSTTLLGGSGNDTLLGGTNDDFIIGGTGNDMIAGGNGDDRIGGRSGNDTLTGGDGNDTLQGGGGRDMIEGGGDSDQLSGAGGRDTITGGDGDDLLRGGAGSDLLDGDGGEDTLAGGAGLDNLAGGVGNDTLNGVFRDDAFSQVAGRDTLFGGQRPAPRPATVNASSGEPVTALPEPRSAAFNVFPGELDRSGDIDDAFIVSLVPALLEL